MSMLAWGLAILAAIGWGAFLSIVAVVVLMGTPECRCACSAPLATDRATTPSGRQKPSNPGMRQGW